MTAGKQRSDLGGFINPDAQNGDIEISVQADLAPSAFDYLAKLPDLSIPVVTLDSISRFRGCMENSCTCQNSENKN